MHIATEDRIATLCPVCECAAFSPTADTFNLSEVLERWQRAGAANFSTAVWQEYTQPEPPTVTLYQCQRCDFGLFQPVVAGSPGFYADITTKDGQCYSPQKWEFLQAIRDINRSHAQSILDIGCGSGYFLDLLRDRCPSRDRAGHELNLEMAELARAKGHRVYHGPFPEAVLSETANQAFDAVCMFQVLEHVPDPVDFLKNARRLLRSGGLLLVGVPNAAGPIRHFSSAVTDIPPHHVSRWCESVFRIGMPRLGFRVLRVAHEPLANYLWGSYLPVMLEQKVRPRILGRLLNRTGATHLLIRMLTRLGLRWLPWVPGHTLYVALQRECDRD